MSRETGILFQLFGSASGGNTDCYPAEFFVPGKSQPKRRVLNYKGRSPRFWSFRTPCAYYRHGADRACKPARKQPQRLEALSDGY